MWIYSVRNVLNYSSVVPYAGQGRSPAGAGLGLLRCRFWGHRRYSRMLSVKAPALSLVLCILLALLLVSLVCLVACYNLPKALQLPLVVLQPPLLPVQLPLVCVLPCCLLGVHRVVDYSYYLTEISSLDVVYTS